MTTTITTYVSTVVSKNEKEGDVTGIPVQTLREKYTFDTDAQAESFNHELRIWLEDFPRPSSEINLFPKRRVTPTQDELFRIIDGFYDRKDLWGDNPIEEATEVLDVPTFMKVNGDAE